MARPGRGPEFAPGIGDRDRQGPATDLGGDLEVPVVDVAVRDDVGGELRDEQGGGVGCRAAVRYAPGVEPVQHERASEACATRSGAEALDEHAYRGGAQHLHQR